MLQTGDKAPEFTLPDETGAQISLTSLLHQGPLILYFYPGDFTPVCTREACMVRDVYDELRAAGLIVAGISPNDEKTHRRFKKQHFLDQTLLADTEKDVIRMFGVDGPFGIGVRRATFLIDPNRQILGTLRADLRLARHEEFLRRAMLVRSILRKDPQPETVTRTRLR